MAKAPKIQLNEAIAAARSVVNGACFSLEQVAFNLREAGLDRPAERIETAIGRLPEALELVSSAFNADLNDQIRSSEMLMGDLLKATLAGCIVPPSTEAA